LSIPDGGSVSASCAGRADGISSVFAEFGRGDGEVMRRAIPLAKESAGTSGVQSSTGTYVFLRKSQTARCRTALPGRLAGPEEPAYARIAGPVPERAGNDETAGAMPWRGHAECSGARKRARGSGPGESNQRPKLSLKGEALASAPRWFFTRWFLMDDLVCPTRTRDSGPSR